MANWGYSINKDNQIDFDKNSREYYYAVLKSEPSFAACIACGSCAGTCSAANFTDFSLRKINILISRGETKGLQSELQKCMLCGKCTLVCPRGVNTRNVILSLRTAILDAGY
jgi:heterodisulfide reductase subunit C